MKNTRTLAFSALLLAALFAAACDWEPMPVDNDVFETRLRGTWESNDPSVYSGKLVIEQKRITISGYQESQTVIPGGDDNRRPFKGFIKDFPLKGYSEKGDTDGEGLIYIEDAGVLQSIPYTYGETPYQYGSTQKQSLRFNFGDRWEILIKTAP